MTLELEEHLADAGQHHRAGHADDEHFGEYRHLFVGLALLLGAIVRVDFANLPPGDAAASGAAGSSGGPAGTNGGQLAKRYGHNQSYS